MALGSTAHRARFVGGPYAGLVLALAVSALVCAPALFSAFFDLDDYRYLDEVSRIRRGEPGALAKALIVENRWDSLWWVPDGTLVRFFRPPVVLSYWLDALCWGADPRGYVLQNVLLHLGATSLCFAFLRALLGAGTATIGALAFGTQPVHWENIAYVAGRTDTIAALPVFGALWLHAATRTRTQALAWAGALLTLVACLCKEYGVLTPLLVLMLEWLHPPADAPRGFAPAARRLAPYLACSALAVLGYALARAFALGELGAGAHPFPYYYLPSRQGFVAHVAAVLALYAQGLVSGALVQSFLYDARQLPGAPLEPIVCSAALFALLVWGVRSPRARFFAAAFVLSVAPLLVLYSSGRYLYLPSLGYAALVALCAEQLSTRRRAVWAPALLIGLVAFPALRLAHRFATLPDRTPFGLARPALRALARHEPPLASERTHVLLDAPATWFDMQFAAVTLATTRAEAPPSLVFLSARSPAAEAAPLLVARVLDAHRLELWRQGAPLIPRDPRFDLDLAPLEAGDRVGRPGYTLHVLESRDGVARRAVVRFDRPLAELSLIAFEGARIVRP